MSFVKTVSFPSLGIPTHRPPDTLQSGYPVTVRVASLSKFAGATSASINSDAEGDSHALDSSKSNRERVYPGTEKPDHHQANRCLGIYRGRTHAPGHSDSDRRSPQW